MSMEMSSATLIQNRAMEPGKSDVSMTSTVSATLSLFSVTLLSRDGQVQLWIAVVRSFLSSEECAAAIFSSWGKTLLFKEQCAAYLLCLA